MHLIDAIVLGIVEGVTEFLPISSTGHLILAGKLIGLPESEFLKSFDIVIQLGAILSVVAIYWKRLLDIELLKRLVVGFLPTGTIGFVVYKLIKTYLLGNTAVVLWSLLLGGIVLILFERLYAPRLASAEGGATHVTYRQALLIGLFQTIAVIPGVSRSGASIVGGMVIGLSRRAAVEFSFLLAVPTMLAASGYDLLKNASSFSLAELDILIVGFVISFVVALLSVKFLLAYVRRFDFVPFGVYRIVMAMMLFAAVF
jgi:undecaprenyl-diphosphatase